MAEARRNKEFPDEDDRERGERPKEIKYIFPALWLKMFKEKFLQ